MCFIFLQSSKAGPSESKPTGKFLGDLPSLNGRDYKQHQDNVKIALSLQLPLDSNQQKLMTAASKATTTATTSNKAEVDSSIPKEFLCSVNGHVMKDPVRVGSKPTGPVFERATIELWLATRGSVCPITGEALMKEDLVPADDLRNRIKRYHIEQTTRRTAAKEEDDLYDF